MIGRIKRQCPDCGCTNTYLVGFSCIHPRCPVFCSYLRAWGGALGNEQRRECPTCRGSGRVNPTTDCPMCDGSGGA